MTSVNNDKNVVDYLPEYSENMVVMTSSYDLMMFYNRKPMNIELHVEAYTDDGTGTYYWAGGLLNYRFKVVNDYPMFARNLPILTFNIDERLSISMRRNGGYPLKYQNGDLVVIPAI